MCHFSLPEAILKLRSDWEMLGKLSSPSLGLTKRFSSKEGSSFKRLFRGGKALFSAPLYKNSYLLTSRLIGNQISRGKSCPAPPSDRIIHTLLLEGLSIVLSWLTSRESWHQE